MPFLGAISGMAMLPLSRSKSAAKRSRYPIATAGSFIFRWIHLLSHCFSCGQTRPHTAGRADVLFNTLAAARNCPRSMFLMNDGILMFTGQPSTQAGLPQSRQRCASRTAISLVRPMFTSSVRVVARYTGSSSGICTRSIALRSAGFMAARNSLRHSALRSVSCSIVSLVGSTSMQVAHSVVITFFSTPRKCSS